MLMAQPVASTARGELSPSLLPMVEPAYCAVSVKPSITTLTWRSEARGEGAVLRGLYWWFNNRNGKPEENGGWKNHGKNGNPWKNYGKPWEGT